MNCNTSYTPPRLHRNTTQTAHHTRHLHVNGEEIQSSRGYMWPNSKILNSLQKIPFACSSRRFLMMTDAGRNIKNCYTQWNVLFSMLQRVTVQENVSHKNSDCPLSWFFPRSSRRVWGECLNSWDFCFLPHRSQFSLHSHSVSRRCIIRDFDSVFK
jgi:hypothetical protein